MNGWGQFFLNCPFISQRDIRTGETVSLDKALPFVNGIARRQQSQLSKRLNYLHQASVMIARCVAGIGCLIAFVPNWNQFAG